MTEYQLKKLPKEVSTDMRILLFGGCGGHVSEDLARVLTGVTYPRAKFSSWAFNTDREDLVELPETINKILIGQEVTGGCGAGSDPRNGLLAAQENEEDISAIISAGEIVIFFAGLGGGTGTGSIPYAVKLFKEQIKDQDKDSLRRKRAGIVFVTTPYAREDRIKHDYAKKAWQELYDLQCPLIVIPNDKFLSEDKADRTIRQMHAEGNKRIAEMLGRLIRSLGKRHNLYNIDRNDIVSNLLIGEDDMPESYCGVGYGSGPNAIQQALEEAANNPLLQVELKTCKKAIIAIDCHDAKESDQIAIHDFMAKYRVHTDADWRVGLHDNYDPLEFEKDNNASAVVMILAVSSVPLKEDQEAAQEAISEIEQSFDLLSESTTATAAIANSAPKIPRPVTTDINEILKSSEPHHAPNINNLSPLAH